VDASSVAAEEAAVEQETRSAAAGRRRSSVTSRAIALAVVILILTISYASSLRIYFTQASDIAATKQQISQSQLRIADLQTELARWNDPAYVKSEARARLGWVMPGETGYKVVGEDGNPLPGSGEINPESKKTEAPGDAWWAKLWGSVEAADKPAPAKEAKPTKVPTITQNTTPSPAPSTPR
jgi:cell division protein FtsB